VTGQEDDVRAAAGGDPAALDRLLRSLWPRAFRIALGITQNPATAEDAAQDALVLVARRLGGLRDAQSFPAWSSRIVVNAASGALRRRERTAVLDDRAAAPSFEDAAAERLDVLQAVRALPLWLRVPLVLRYVDGLTSREIGSALNAPSATIRFRLALGRRRLASVLGADNTVSEDFA
jgi:RNA polymerase sigma-70 factor (ECF subfamily)